MARGSNTFLSKTLFDNFPLHQPNHPWLRKHQAVHLATNWFIPHFCPRQDDNLSIHDVSLLMRYSCEHFNPTFLMQQLHLKLSFANIWRLYFRSTFGKKITISPSVAPLHNTIFVQQKFLPRTRILFCIRSNTSKSIGIPLDRTNAPCATPPPSSNLTEPMSCVLPRTFMIVLTGRYPLSN